MVCSKSVESGLMISEICVLIWDEVAWEAFLDKEDTMTANDIVDLVRGLIIADTGIQPPYTVVVPAGTNLEQQFYDGRESLCTLKEELLRIKDVMAVRIGSGSGIHLEHFISDAVSCGKSQE